MPTTLSDLMAAVEATNTVIKDPDRTEADLEKAAEHEQETVAAYLQDNHAQAHAEAQMEAGG
jgi:hypothetical protein